MLLLLLLSHRKQILCRSGSAARIHSHSHAYKAVHGSCLVACRRLHGICLRTYKRCRRHGGIPHDRRTLCLLDHIRILVRQCDRTESDADDLQTPQLSPFFGKRRVHGIFKIGIVCHNLVGAQLKLGQTSECRLQCADKLCFQLAVKLIPGIFLLHVAADVRIEQQRVSDPVRIHARAPHRHVQIQPDLGIHHTEGNGVRGAEFVVDKLLGVEIIHPLILAGISAVGETLTDGPEGLLDALAELAREKGRLG